MNLLDDLQHIKKLDRNNSFDSIKAMPEQLLAAWQTAKKLQTATAYRQATKIVFTGMGGSALGARVVESLFEKQFKVPFFIRTEYQLPEFIDQKTLVIVASYSGNTEETLSAYEEALARRAMVFVYTSGGKLGEEIKKGKVPGLIFKPALNFLGYPKTALGYSLGMILGILTQLGYLPLTEKDLFAAGNELKKIKLQALAQKMARDLAGKIGVFVASEHLKGAAYAFRNQVCEIGHAFANYFDLPEMNHFLVEGFASPQEAKDYFSYFFFSSSLYSQSVTKRYPLTQEILDKLKIANFEYQLQTKNKLAQALELVNLGGLTAFYLSILKNEDPGPEPWIIYLKAKLRKVVDEKCCP